MVTPATVQGWAINGLSGHQWVREGACIIFDSVFGTLVPYLVVYFVPHLNSMLGQVHKVVAEP